MATQHAARGVLFIDPVRALSRLVGTGAVSLLATGNMRFVHDGVVSIRKCFVPSEMRLLARLAPLGESLDAFYLPPGFVVLRSRLS